MIEKYKENYKMLLLQKLYNNNNHNNVWGSEDENMNQTLKNAYISLLMNNLL